MDRAWDSGRWPSGSPEAEEETVRMPATESVDGRADATVDVVAYAQRPKAFDSGTNPWPKARPATSSTFCVADGQWRMLAWRVSVAFWWHVSGVPGPGMVCNYHR